MNDIKSKIFIAIFIISIVISIAMTYYRYVVLEDFSIFTDQELFNQSLIDQ